MLYVAGWAWRRIAYFPVDEEICFKRHYQGDVSCAFCKPTGLYATVGTIFDQVADFVTFTDFLLIESLGASPTSRPPRTPYRRHCGEEDA